MAGLYEEEILGAKQQAETARKLRELAFAQGVPQGQIVGNRFVGPHWTQHLGNLLRQYNLGNQEQEASQKVENLTRERNRATADLMAQAGVPVSDTILKAASVPAVSPTLIEKLRGVVTGEEAKGTPEQVYQPKMAQNVTPEMREGALMQLAHVNPDVGQPLLTYMGTKAHREEAMAEKERAREERQQAREENLALKRDMWNAVHGGQPSESGVNMGPRIKTGGGGDGGVDIGAGGALGGAVNRKDIQIMKLPNGQLARVNKRTGDVMPLEAEGNVPKETKEQGRDVPVAQFDAHTANKAVIKQIDDALAMVDANKDAFGAKNLAGQFIMQRVDPEGVDPRGAVGEIGAVKIHDLSGAAVSASEAPRFSPFVPNATDTPEKIKKNLQKMRKSLIDLETERAKTYSKESGFKSQLKATEMPQAEPATPSPAPASGWSITEIK
jgi:hypothetical protein